ncbi:MAG: hypothetical protein ACRDP3_06915, partial [Streptomyces sp.]
MEPISQRPTGRARRAVERAAEAARPVPLAEVLSRAELLARFDRAYLVPADTFADFAALLTDPRRREPYRALSIGG